MYVIGGVCHQGVSMSFCDRLFFGFLIATKNGRRILLEFVLLIFLPIVAALFVPLLFKKLKGIHTGWFVLFVPLVLFIYYISFIGQTMDGEDAISELPWIPSLDISFVSYIDGLSLLFSLLITGIGALVVLYSIFYLDKDKEKLNNFYVYLLMFMTAMLRCCAIRSCHYALFILGVNIHFFIFTYRLLV